MPRTKNNFLNAKPVSKVGGKSGGVRKPGKPYSKPPAAKKATPKVKAKAAKPSPKSPDPWKASTPKNSRTSAPKGNATFRTQNTGITMPNSRRAGVNLPKTGARAERTAARVADLRKASTPKPNAPAGASSAVRGAASAGARGLARGAGKLLGRAAVPVAIADKAKEVFNPRDNIITRGAALGRSIERVVGSGGGSKMTPAQRAAQLNDKRNKKPTKPPLNSTGVRVSDKANQRDYKAAPTGSKQYNDFRNRQIAGERERLKNVGNPSKPKPKPPAPVADQRRSGGGGNNTAPRSQTPPKPRFTGTVDEGRKMWAEKYSSSKYDGQAIQKEAKKLLDEMRKRKENKSNATKAGWDGNKNY